MQSDNGKQGYKVGGKKYCRPKVVPFPAALEVDIAAIGFGEAKNPELAAWVCSSIITVTATWRMSVKYTCFSWLLWI